MDDYLRMRVEMDLKEFKAAWEPRDYSSPARRKQLIEREFKKIGKAFANIGRSDAWVNEEQRKAVLMKVMDQARERFSSLRVHSIEESLTEFETICLQTTATWRTSTTIPSAQPYGCWMN